VTLRWTSLAAVVAKDDEREEQAEGEGRDHEEVDGDELSGVRGEEGAPRGRRPRRRPVHVLGDGQLGDLVAGQREFRLDAAAAPRRILPRHPSDQVAQLGAEPRAPDPAPRGLPSPVELEALAVPGEDGRGLNDDETGPPARPDLREPDPEDSVPPCQAWSANGSLENQELMAKCEVLKRDGGGTGKEGAQEGPETGRENHRGSRHEARRLS
jgi:hypothetical protein